MSLLKYMYMYMYFCYMPYTYNNTYMVEPVYNGQPWDLQTWLLLSEVILLYSVRMH